MAQVESNSDPKFSKGGGSAKKHQGKPGRDSLDAMIKQLKALVPHLQEDELERVLEKNNYDINKSADYIYDGNPIPTESSEWQQVSRNSKQETKAKTQDKRNDIVEKKEKVNRTDSDKRIDREDKRNDGRSDRKPKKPDARFGTDGAPDIHRAPRDRDSKSNGSPNPQSRPPRRSPAPTHAGAPTTKPAGAQPLQTQPTTQTPHPSISNQHTWGPPGGSAHAQAPVTTTPPPTNPTPSQQPAQSQSQSQAPSQPQPSSSTAGAAATRPSYTSAAATSLSYAKIVQGKPQPTPPPQQVTPHPPTSSQQTTAANAAGAPTSTPPSNTHPSTGAPGKQPEFQQSSPSGSRAHNRASPTWRPKEPSSSVTSPSLATTPATSAATATTTQATAPVSTTTTQAVSLPATQQPATTTPSQPAAPVQAAQPSPVAQAPIQAAAPQVAQTQPAPISPPTAATTQPKKQPVVVGAGGVIFPPSLQYADNLSIPFGSFGLENKSNDQGLVLHFGTQPTTPAQQTAPIAAQQAASPSAVPAQQPVSTAQVPVQQQQVHPSHSSPHSQHVSPQHAAPTPASAHQQQPGSHVPSHLPSQQQQQQLHLNGDPNLGGHLDQTDVHGYPYMPSPYFHMPGFGFADGNPDDRMRAYYDHPTGASYAPADSNTAQSAVPQNSQSPPPNSPSQYHMQPYYNPYYNMHPYYQTSAPSQFQQFPGSYIYGYNRMGAGGYPPAVHSSSSPASQAHSQYEEADYKYLNQPQSSYNFYSSSSPAASTSAGSVPGSASSVKPASYSPTPTAGVDSSNKDYNNKYRTEPSSFYNNLSSPQGPHSHSHSHSHSQQFSHQPHSFMGQHNIGGPQSIPSQSSAYHHSPQPLSNQQHVQGQSGGSQRPYPGLS